MCWEALLILTVATGLRQGEVLGFRWDDRDLEHGILQVRRQLQRDKTYSAPKAKSRRRIDLAAPEVRALERHRGRQEADRLTHGNAYEDHDLIFCTYRGRPLGWRNVTREFKKHLRATGLRDIRFHDLRHTNATLMLEAGVHPKVVQERLGHSDITITLNVFSHVMPTLGQDAAEQIHDVLSDDEPADGVGTDAGPDDTIARGTDPTVG